MKLQHFLRFGIVAVFCSLAVAQDQPDKPNIIKLDKNKIIKIDPNNPNQKIEIKQPARKKTEPKVSPTAKALLDKITAAYKKLNSIEVAGKLSAEIDLGGEKQSRTATFTGAFQAPNKFRHEMKEQDADPKDGHLIVGSTGEQLFAFQTQANEYHAAEAPKDRQPASKMPRPMHTLLEQQNAGLMCAIVDDAGNFLIEDTLEVNGPVDVQISGKAFAALDFKGEKSDYRVIVDPGTSLVRQIVLDMKRSIEAAGRSDVNKFLLTFDYTRTVADGAIKAEAFAWTAPDGAREITAAAAAMAHGEELMAQAAGKAAPDFTLKGMDGKEVSLKDHKGSVVVLDFWATWCGPCKASLPGLNKIYTDLKDKGLVVYAIDMQEPKDKVQAVANELKLDIPVLLDEKSEVANQFGVNGIPHTVVIGKDQKIINVFVGAGNEARIRAAVESAMSGK